MIHLSKSMRAKWGLALSLRGGCSNCGRVLLTLLTLFCVNSAARADEEFLGPFASWADVKRDFGAVGDGKADDTAAIQKGMDALTTHKQFCVLYFPAGTYRITATLRTVRKAHTDGMISIIGADPTRTIIRWDGPKDGVIVHYDAWYAKISRLTLDGASKAKVALGYGDGFSTYNETSDMVFKDVVDGIFFGMGTAGQAENAVLRSRFLRCSDAGVRTNGFNSMDIWVWDSQFQDCGYCLYNVAGNFHAYHNLFQRSKIMDIGIANLMVFAIVNNTSIGSKCFLDWRSGMTWGSPTSITGNRIIDTVDDFAIRLGNSGPYLIMDNVFKGRAGAKAPQIDMTWGDQSYIGNTFTSANPFAKLGRFRWLDNKTVAPLTIDSSLPSMPASPRHFERKVFEVVRGSNAGAIQLLIDEAVKLEGQRPVVHLPMGVYRIDRTLQTPAGSDVQIVGDGASEIATVLNWVGKPGEPLLRLAGPARASIRDLHIKAGTGIGIAVEACDQPGGKVFADQLKVTGLSANAKAAAGIWIDRVEESDVLLQNLQGGSSLKSWLKVTGGTRQRAGLQSDGQNSVFCGASGSLDSPYALEDGGRLVVRTVYHEIDETGGVLPTAIKLTDSATLNVDTTRFSYKTSDQVPLISCQGMRGSFAATTCFFMPVHSTYPAWIQVHGDGAQCNALCLDCLFWSPEKPTASDVVWKNEARPAASAAFLECHQNGQAKDGQGFNGMLAYRNSPNDDGLIRTALKPLRDARLWRPADSKTGITNLCLYRVMISSGSNGIGVWFKAGK